MSSAWSTTCHPAWDSSCHGSTEWKHYFRKINETLGLKLKEEAGSRKLSMPDHCNTYQQTSKGLIYSCLHSDWSPKPKIQVGSLERAKTGRTSLGVHSAGKAPASWWGSMMSLASGGLWSVTQGQTQSYPLEFLTPIFQRLGDNKQIPQERRTRCGIQ